MREYPPYAIAAVGAVVIRDESIILVKRGYPPAQNRWSIPGGVIEAGEKIFDAAKRELYEETGLIARPVGIVYVVNNVVKDIQNNTKYHYVILDILFDAKSIEGTPRPGGDAIDVAWIPLKEAIEREDVTRTTKHLINGLLKGGFNLLQAEEMEFQLR